MFCPTCGAFNKASATTCVDCGRSLRPGASPTPANAPRAAAGPRPALEYADTQPSVLEPSSSTYDSRFVEGAPRTPVALWNPNAAGLWSLLFSPAFGAYLHMLNWQALGEPEKAKESKMWFVACLVMLGVYVLLNLALPGKAGDGLARFLGLGLVIAWWVASGKKQLLYVTQHFGKTYPRRPWGKALGWGVLAIVGYFLVSFCVGFVLALAGVLK